VGARCSPVGWDTVLQAGRIAALQCGTQEHRDMYIADVFCGASSACSSMHQWAPPSCDANIDRSLERVGCLCSHGSTPRAQEDRPRVLMSRYGSSSVCWRTQRHTVCLTRQKRV
jgi:hypothetical protein